MRRFAYETVDVFSDRPFGGNPLAVFTDARGLSDAEMQALAAEMNYSETTFVLPPDDPRHTARVRIFHRTAEMPFAGHPNVGTACVLARQGRASDGVLLFEEIAGLVKVRVVQRDGDIAGAVIDAPQPLSLGMTLPCDGLAACAGLAAADIVVAAHEPVVASVGVAFVLAQVAGEALGRCAPDLAAFRRLAAAHPELGGRLSLCLYAPDGPDMRARMFAPLAGTWEDPATGSAGAALAALRLQLDGGERIAFAIRQGAEMGRPSLLQVTAAREGAAIRATVGGDCVPMLRGSALLPDQ